LEDSVFPTKIIKLFIFMKKLNKGFTLIELLVVIAIIGILSSVVLASLNTARAKGADAAIKSGLSNMRAQAELDYDNSGCYSATAGDCTFSASAVAACAAGATELIWQDNQIEAALEAAGDASNGGGIGRASCSQAANGGAWAISIPLRSDATVGWCIDSTGASKQITGVHTGTAC
jgi:prepilin-type N-terminal cleavage/methylation domain-containing protein